MNVLAECPVSILKAHPLAILVLMRSMFNWRLIPKMMELKVLLMEVVEENAALSDEERGNRRTRREYLYRSGNARCPDIPPEAAAWYDMTHKIRYRWFYA